MTACETQIAMKTPLLTVQHFSLFRQNQPLLSDLNFQLQTQQCLGVVGESGSGKSLLSRALAGLLTPDFQLQGNIQFKQKPILAHRVTQGIGLLPQQPQTAFNPVLRLEKQFHQMLKQSRFCRELSLSSVHRTEKMVYWLEQVQLSPDLLKRYPHQLSGGQLQRLMLAFNLALEPQLLIADEPTSALDLHTQRELIPLFKQLTQKQGCALMFITHDLGLIKEIADHILVLKAGQAVEFGEKKAIFQQPKSPYTAYLLAMREKLDQAFQKAMGEIQ